MADDTVAVFQGADPMSTGVRPGLSFGRGMVLPSGSLPFHVSSPFMGRGRGVSRSTDECGVRRFVSDGDSSACHSAQSQPRPDAPQTPYTLGPVQTVLGAEPPYTSTPVHPNPAGQAPQPCDPVPQLTDTDGTIHQLGFLISELGKHIGDSVTARLLSERDAIGNQSNGVGGVQAGGTTVDLSQLNMVLKSDGKEPPVFRGDTTDKCTVHEWLDLMKMYLKKRSVVIADQPDEIMNKLMGRAKDVVRIGLRSDPLLSIDQKPDTIYAILKQHFSDLSHSCMPLADFYSTLPRVRESPIDYWVRLNKAADAAEECLQRQGRDMGDLTKEVALMFVRHCNEPALSTVFRSKLASSWSVKEVQERIDEYQREMKSRPSAPIGERVTRQAVAVVDECIQEAGRIDPGASLHCNRQSVGQTQPQPSVELAKIQADVDKMSMMLGDLLSKFSASAPARPPASWGSNTSSKKKRIPVPKTCEICNDSSHSTVGHCQLNRLCFICHQPGHMKLQCPNATAPTTPESVHQSGQSSHQLNGIART